MTTTNLGQLDQVDLRDVWESESSQFTPWLAEEENLAILGTTLGIELELEAQEKTVGPFRADILCKDTGTGSWVLIENQLERTDHGHLGQLLTYASGLEAVTVVWIAARFTEEHRSTLDWLNKITDEECRFFGLEIELWRIGDSPAAPKFNVVSKPNAWSRSVTRATNVIDETEQTEVRKMQLQYWTRFREFLDGADVPFAGKRTPRPRAAMNHTIGKSGMHLATVMVRPKKRIRVELYLFDEHAKEFFFLLRKQRKEIEEKLGCTLEWEELPNGSHSRIATYRDNTDPDDREDWPRQHKWLAESLKLMHGVFATRVKELDPADWVGDADGDSD